MVCQVLPSGNRRGSGQVIAFFAKLAFGGLGLAKRGLALLGKLNIWQILCIGLFVAAALFYVQRNNARDDLDTARTNLNECREARKQDRLAYEDAQRKAHEANEAEVKRIETEQESINAEAKSRYERDLARLRAGGLRKDLAAPKGSAGCAEAGADGKAAAGVDGENVCVPRSLLVRAAEIELGRNALIDWINEQLGVRR
jgi:hypothetical protein